jgi:hypothetical protein
MANFKNGMKETKKKATQTVTASQKIDMLEKTTSTLRKMIEVMAEEMDKIQQSQIAMAKRLEATLKVASDGELNETKVNEFVINQQVKEYKDKVDLLVSQGALGESEEVNENSFVVGKEVSKDGEIISPRTQASIKSLPEDVRKALVGKKAGDLVSFGDDKLAFMVDEIYTINQPKETQVNLETAGA